ncbi:hypothetical protein JTB14_009652 [Gonioctena quinquepunctata]|nr:hypothetical protein JTB14_009652 [Gonioctena quinquepunctata]
MNAYAHATDAKYGQAKQHQKTGFSWSRTVHTSLDVTSWLFREGHSPERKSKARERAMKTWEKARDEIMDTGQWTKCLVPSLDQWVKCKFKRVDYFSIQLGKEEDGTRIYLLQ